MSDSRHLLTRLPAVLIAVAALLASTSGCAVATRILFTADAFAAVHDVVGSGTNSASDPNTSGSAATVGGAVVYGTAGSGLWIREMPGGRGIIVLAEGSIVTPSCRRDGPSARGPRGTTTHWVLLRSANDDTGFASGAYLLSPDGVATLPPCP